MTRTLRPAATVLALTLVALAPRASASGFQLREQSPSAQGNSFAGISAGGSDIGGMFFNPATLTLFQGTEAILGGSLVHPVADFSGGSAHRSTQLPAAYVDISGSADHTNAAKGAVLPNLYAMHSLSPDLKVGLSINVPFGLVTNYDAGWIGRYHAIRSDLKTLDIAPTVAWRLNDQWSFGAAAVARQAKADLSNAVDFGLLGMLHQVPNYAPGHNDSIATLKGDTWAYGFKAGILFQPTTELRVGLGYQAAMDMKLKGTVAYSNTQNAPFAPSGIKDGGIHADLNLPATTSLGFAYQVCAPFTLQGEVARTSWSRFKELRVRFDTVPTPDDNVTIENWKDSTFVSLGGTWKVTPVWTVRMGIAYDQAPVSDELRTPRIPDSDRKWVSVGFGHEVNRMVSLDMGYSHLFAKDATLDLQDGGTGRGYLKGSYKVSVDALTFQARLRF